MMFHFGNNVLNHIVLLMNIWMLTYNTSIYIFPNECDEEVNITHVYNKLIITTRYVSNMGIDYSFRRVYFIVQFMCVGQDCPANHLPVKIHLVITWHVQVTNHRLNTTQLYLKTTIENDRGFVTCNLVLMDKIWDYYSCVRFYAFLELQYLIFDRFQGNIEKNKW